MMSKFNFLFVLLTALCVAGCTTNATHSGSDKVSKVNAYNLLDSKVEATGFKYYIEKPSSAVEAELGKSLVQSIIEKMKSALNSSGFEMVQSSRKAHLFVRLATDKKFDLTNNQTDDVSSVQTLKIYRGGELVSETSGTGPINRMAIGGVWQNYGKTTEMYFKFTLETFSPWDTVQSEVLESLSTMMSTTPLKPRNPALKMSGDPGCVLRFGFDAEPFADKFGTTYYRIYNVVPQSSATAAGIKTGDFVLAIDSVAYQDWITRDSDADDVYNKSILVPIKLMRDGKIIRSHIKSKLICDK